MPHYVDEYIETLVEARLILRRDAASLQRCTSRGLKALGHEGGRIAAFADLVEQLVVIDAKLSAAISLRNWAAKSEEEHEADAAMVKECFARSNALWADPPASEPADSDLPL